MCAPHLDSFCSTLYRTKYYEPRLAHVSDVYMRAEIQFTITTLERIVWCTSSVTAAMHFLLVSYHGFEKIIKERNNFRLKFCYLISYFWTKTNRTSSLIYWYNIIDTVDINQFIVYKNELKAVHLWLHLCDVCVMQDQICNVWR